MMKSSAPAPARSKPLGKVVSADTSWRGRTALVCTILALMIIGVGAASLDWSTGLAMTLGQLAGMIAPLVVLMLMGWALASVVSRQR
jgi:hypothetical protein